VTIPGPAGGLDWHKKRNEVDDWPIRDVSGPRPSSLRLPRGTMGTRVTVFNSGRLLHPARPLRGPRRLRQAPTRIVTTADPAQGRVGTGSTLQPHRARKGKQVPNRGTFYPAKKPSSAFSVRSPSPNPITPGLHGGALPPGTSPTAGSVTYTRRAILHPRPTPTASTVKLQLYSRHFLPRRADGRDQCSKSGQRLFTRAARNVFPGRHGTQGSAGPITTTWDGATVGDKATSVLPTAGRPGLLVAPAGGGHGPPGQAARRFPGRPFALPDTGADIGSKNLPTGSYGAADWGDPVPPGT